ncbi:AraC family transcriptional regulator [Enterobacter chuandaensis]|uniref:helix-turn-helix domain-containing protein n=1 Tax=Enterobacter chuandaensis TaxID=2497875 RepID=UPI001FCC8219|nr:AraC family transcriptional regulator [Enterobacter chuandaensis]MCM7588694.1 AraC family transcriptional regulator [Enterobacter chuandaensis]
MMNNHEVILKDTVKEMTRVLKNQPELSITSSNPLSVNCYRWPHGPLHETIAPMDQHVIIAHFGNMQTVERRTGHQVVRDTIREGTITTIPRGSSSRWDMSGTVDVIHFYIPDQTFNDLLLQVDAPLTELLFRTAYFDDTTAKIISAIHDTLSDNNRITHLLCEHLMLALVLQLIQNHSPVKAHVQQANYFLSPRVLKNSLEILDSSPIGEVTIQALAAEQGMSSAHFCRAFKNSTGLTPYGWLKQRVMERAFLQLQSTNKQVSEIALESGYNSQNAFTSAFRKMTGLTPSQWRKKSHAAK